MFTRVTSHLKKRAALLLAGRLDELAESYSYPFPLFLASSRLIVQNADEAKAMLLLQRALYLGRNVVALEPEVTAMDLPRNGRFRLWVDWHEKTLRDDQENVSSVVYYCRITPAGARIEMMQYTRLSMPEHKPHFAALALSA